MVKSLKVGVAGLGTVGAALIAQVARQQEALAARCGRRIEIVAVSARSKAKDRGIDLKKIKWFADPLALARLLQVPPADFLEIGLPEASRAPSGSESLGRWPIAEKSIRSDGSMTPSLIITPPS